MINKKKHKLKNSLLSWSDYLKFFLLIGGAITASFFLFFRFYHISFEDIKLSAIITLGNVIFITLLCTSVYGLWKHFQIDKPVNNILDATEKISHGNFEGNVKQIHKNENNYNEFDLIINNINTMAKELNSIETMRTDFISNVSHELKTPITTIQNYATILQTDNISEEERKEYASYIIEASKYLSTLITNILRLNKLENQEIVLNKRKYNLSEQLVQRILSFENNIDEKNINVETNIQDNVFVESDEELLSIIWNNLLSNAIKYSHQNGQINISLKETNGIINVIISDDGIGMNDETLKHIFDKFYQGDTSRSSSGNGLGLALVKRICDITQSRINVESKINLGSTFTIIIPKNHN